MKTRKYGRIAHVAVKGIRINAFAPREEPLYFKAPLSTGESVTVNGVTIKVVKSDDAGDTVEISK